jgi:choloylglycine hydrolase
MLEKVAVSDEAEGGFSPTPLHWMLADGRDTAVVESVESGLRVYDNPAGVLTNSPELHYHMTRLEDYSSLSAKNPEGGLYSRGLGAIGLPGDFSSGSRFVRAAYLRKKCFGERETDTKDELYRAHSILSCLSVPVGAVITDEGLPSFTLYSAVIDLAEPTYYLTTASCSAIHQTSLTDRLCDGKGIQSYPIYKEEKFPSLTEE